MRKELTQQHQISEVSLLTVNRNTVTLGLGSLVEFSRRCLPSQHCQQILRRNLPCDTLGFLWRLWGSLAWTS